MTDPLLYRLHHVCGKENLLCEKFWVLMLRIQSSMMIGAMYKSKRVLSNGDMIQVPVTTALLVNICKITWQKNGKTHVVPVVTPLRVNK